MTRLPIRVQPAAKANAALIELLAETLALRTRQITLERGDKSRTKFVLVDGLTWEEVRKQLG